MFDERDSFLMSYDYRKKLCTSRVGSNTSMNPSAQGGGGSVGGRGIIKREVD